MTIERLVPIMDSAGLDRVIVVPPSLKGIRFDYGQEAARRHPGRFATMGRVNPNDPTEKCAWQAWWVLIICWARALIFNPQAQNSWWTEPQTGFVRLQKQLPWQHI